MSLQKQDEIKVMLNIPSIRLQAGIVLELIFDIEIPRSNQGPKSVGRKDLPSKMFHLIHILVLR